MADEEEYKFNTDELTFAKTICNEIILIHLMRQFLSRLPQVEAQAAWQSIKDGADELNDLLNSGEDSRNKAWKKEMSNNFDIVLSSAKPIYKSAETGHES